MSIPKYNKIYCIWSFSGHVEIFLALRLRWVAGGGRLVLIIEVAQEVATEEMLKTHHRVAEASEVVFVGKDWYSWISLWASLRFFWRSFERFLICLKFSWFFGGSTAQGSWIPKSHPTLVNSKVQIECQAALNHRHETSTLTLSFDSGSDSNSLDSSQSHSREAKSLRRLLHAKASSHPAFRPVLPVSLSASSPTGAVASAAGSGTSWGSDGSSLFESVGLTPIHKPFNASYDKSDCTNIRFTRIRNDQEWCKYAPSSSRAASISLQELIFSLMETSTGTQLQDPILPLAAILCASACRLALRPPPRQSLCLRKGTAKALDDSASFSAVRDVLTCVGMSCWNYNLCFELCNLCDFFVG